MIKKIVLSLSLVLIAILAVFLIGNDYQMKEQRVSIPTTGGTLSAVITAPKKQKINGVVVFVHGDGPQEATQEGGYKPLMERFAKQGYASISWDKLGVGQSSGNWLSQSMDDRGKEVEQVIKWLKENKPEMVDKIGLWGASQAGWVIPKVLNSQEDIAFSILVAPAINWQSQGKYNTMEELRAAGKSEQELQKAGVDFDAESELIKKNNSYQDYLKSGGEYDLSEDRYGFIQRNINSDASKDLEGVRSKIYLVLAEKDQNVDSDETKRIYSQKLASGYLQVKVIKNAEHMMLNPKIAHSSFLVQTIGLFLPKYFLINEDYLNYCENSLKEQQEEF